MPKPTPFTPDGPRRQRSAPRTRPLGRPPSGARPQGAQRAPLTLRAIWRFLPAGHRGKAQAAFGAAVIAATGLGVAALWNSGAFAVREVRVVGADVLNERVLVQRSGLRGQNIITLDLDSTARDLERAFPLIADARVERVWPLGARIVMAERQPWAVWERGNRRYIVDQTGYVLQNASVSVALPSVIDTRKDAQTEPIGERVPADALKAVSYLASFLPASTGLQPRSFRFDDEHGLIVTTSDGHTAIFGNSVDLAYKLAVWKALLVSARQEELPLAWVEMVDLRYGAHPSLTSAIDTDARPIPTVRSGGGATPTPSPTPITTTGLPGTVQLETATPEPGTSGLAGGDAGRPTSNGGQSGR